MVNDLTTGYYILMFHTETAKNASHSHFLQEFLKYSLLSFFFNECTRATSTFYSEGKAIFLAVFSRKYENIFTFYKTYLE